MARTTLRESDVRTMLRVVDARRDDNDDGPLPRSVFAALSRLVGADAIMFLCLDSEHQQTPVYQASGELVETDVVPEHVFWSHYWTATFCSYPDRTGDVGSVTRMSDFGGNAALRRSALWSEYLRPFGVYREMMLCLPSRPLHTVRLLLARGPGADFTERDRGLLALLRPHLDARFREWQRSRQPVPLTPRQRELLALVADGRTNGQIARRLGITEGTVRSHMDNVFQRLQVTSRAAAVVKAFPDGYDAVAASRAGGGPGTRNRRNQAWK